MGTLKTARAFVLLMTLGGCDAFLGPDPANTPLNNYDILWKEFDRYYSFFQYKSIDWDSLNAIHRPRADSVWTDAQLFPVVSDLVSSLKDIHVNVQTPYGTYMYQEWMQGVNRNFSRPVALGGYLGSSYQRSGPFEHGSISDGIGYIYIGSFGGDQASFELIDAVLARFAGSHGLVIDVRDNGGGSDLNSDLVVQRFLDKERIIRYVRWRSGPGHSDFTDPIAKRLGPDGSTRYAGPIVLLTNRWCFSATESFVLALRERPNVIHMGDTTGGGMGNPIHRELPNGWTYRLPTWIQYDAALNIYEGRGIPPESVVTFPDSVSFQGVDPIIVNAAALLASIPAVPASGNQ